MNMRFRAAATVGLAATTLAACGSSHGASPSQTAARSPGETTGASVSMGDFLGPYMVDVAQHESLTKNLDLHLAQLASGSAALPLMISGKMDGVTDIGVPPLVTAAAAKLPLQIVWYAGEDPAGIYTKPQIQSAKQLAGENVAAPAGSIAEIALAEYLEQQGVGFSKIHFVNLPPGSIPASYKTGQIAGASIWTPVTTALRTAGAKLLVNQPETAYTVFSSKFVSDHPAAVQTYVCDIARAQDLRRTNPTRVYRDLAASQGTTASGVQAEMPTNPPSKQLTAGLMGRPGQPPASRVKEIVDAGHTMAGLNLIPNAPSTSTVRAMFNAEFAQYVAAGKCTK